MLPAFGYSRTSLLAVLVAEAVGHGALISPRSRNSVDYLVGVNTPVDWPSNADCTNISGAYQGDCRNLGSTTNYDNSIMTLSPFTRL